MKNDLKYILKAAVVIAVALAFVMPASAIVKNNIEKDMVEQYSPRFSTMGGSPEPLYITITIINCR